jgi:hypothetical protein
MAEKKKNKFVMSCWNCWWHKDIGKKEAGEPDFCTFDRGKKMEPRHYCMAEALEGGDGKALDSSETGTYNSRMGHIEEAIGERTRLNNPDLMQDIPFEERKLDANNSYSAGYTYGVDLGMKMDNDWAFFNCKGCKLYKSIRDGEIEEEARKNGKELRAFMAKQKKATKKELVYDKKLGKIVEREVKI